VDILSLTIGFVFLWHFLICKILPFFPGTIGFQDGGSIYLLLIVLSPLSYLVYKIYEKYGNFDATISLALSILIVFFSANIIKNLFDKLTLNPYVNWLYNFAYTILLFGFFKNLLK
jgi:hypothetical protein